jgi:hypothetical protein
MTACVSEQPEVADRLCSAFPASLAYDVATVFDWIPAAQHTPSPHDIGPILVAGERLRIPFRFYSAPPHESAMPELKPDQNAILSCIYTRHHDGYIRQEFAGRLFKRDQPWVIPFLLQLVGEYVCEIVQLVLDHVPDLNSDTIGTFAAENPQFIAITCRRVISYWNEYYRRQFPRFIDYPGYQIMNLLQLWCKHVSPDLLSR